MNISLNKKSRPTGSPGRKKLAIVLILIGACSISSTVMAQRTLNLNEAIQIAQTSSPNIKKSMLNLFSNQRMLDAQRASLKTKFALNVTPIQYDRNREFDPKSSQWNLREGYNSFAHLIVSQPILATDGTVSLENEFGYWDNYSEYLGFSEEIKNYNNNLFLRVNQPIFTYNRTKLQLRELELNLENAQISNALQLLSLEQNVTQSFNALFQRQNDLEIASDEYENQKISYEITINKVDADLLAQEELYQAELNLATSKSTLENTQVILKNTADNLKILLGIDLEEELAVAVDVKFVTHEVDLNKAIQFGLENRMELRQRAIDIERSQFELIRTKAENEFKGTIALSLRLIGNDERPTDVYQNASMNPAFGVSFSIPIFDWGANKAKMEAVNANLEINKIDLEVEENNIVLDIRKTYRSLQNLENQIEIAEQNVKNAELTYEINLERYKNGDLTSMDLNRFQSQLSEKKTSLADALINYKMELLNMKIISLYDFEKQQPVIIPTSNN